MARFPNFANYPIAYLGQTTAASTSRATPGANSVVVVPRPRTYDLAIMSIDLSAIDTTAAVGTVRFYIGDGTNLRRYGPEIVIDAIASVDADTPAWTSQVINETNERLPWLVLPKDNSLVVATTIADDIDVVIAGAEYRT